MKLPAPQPGLVLRYAYLWSHEFAAGHEEGSKERPCAVILTVEDNGGDTTVSVVPISHTEPVTPDDGIEIPGATKARLGLDADRSWIIVSEVNMFTWPGPDLRAVPQSDPPRFDYGLLPPKLFRAVRDRLARRIRNNLMLAIRRTE